MSKRGSVESAVLLAVVIVALIGLFFALKPVAEKKQGEVSVVAVPGPTGNFAVPAAKEYGGAVRGVAVTGTRAFPAGRALETEVQFCYSCSCLEEGITAVDKSSAERVCRDNCQGAITGFEAGACR